MDETFEKIKKLIADKLEIDASKVTMKLLSARILVQTALIPMNSSMHLKMRWVFQSPMKGKRV
jgi:hypothetical protein